VPPSNATSEGKKRCFSPVPERFDWLRGGFVIILCSLSLLHFRLVCLHNLDCSGNALPVRYLVCRCADACMHRYVGTNRGFPLLLLPLIADAN